MEKVTLVEVREVCHVLCYTKKLVCRKEAETRNDLESPANIQNAVPLILTARSKPILPRCMSEKIPLGTSVQLGFRH